MICPWDHPVRLVDQRSDPYLIASTSSMAHRGFGLAVSPGVLRISFAQGQRGSEAAMTTLNHPIFAGVIESKQPTRCPGRFTQGESRQFEEGLDGHARLAPGLASLHFLLFFIIIFFPFFFSESSMSNRVDVCMGCKGLFKKQRVQSTAFDFRQPPRQSVA